MAKPILRILSPVIGAEEQLLVLGPSAITLGRGEDNDVVLLEQAASRDHARVEPCEGGYEIVDCNSAAGLWLKGARVKRHKLEDGDEIKVGGTVLRYVASAHSEPTVVPSAASSTATAPPAWSLDPEPAPTEATAPAEATPQAEEIAPTLLPEDTAAALEAAEDDAAAAPSPSPSPSASPPPSQMGTVAAVHVDAQPVAAPKGTVAAEHVEAPPAGAAKGTVAAAHVEAAAPTAPGPDEAAKSDASGYSLGVDGSSPSASGYSLDGSAAGSAAGSALDPALGSGPAPSSASVYSLDGSGPAQREGMSLGDAPSASEVGGLKLDMPAAKSPSTGGDSGYSLDSRDDDPFASVSLHGGPPGYDGGRQRTGAGTIVLFLVVGAAAAFGILTALQGPPW